MPTLFRLLTALVVAGAPADTHQDVVRVARDVYAIVRRDPIGYGNNANALLVVGDRDVLVVDAQFTREATLEVLAALRQVTNKPVRYVVNTHWHDDHVAGNQVYADSFPGVAFVAHANTRDDLIAFGRPNRAANLGGIPSAAARFERLMAAGLGADSTPIAPRERATLERNVAIVRQYAAEAPGFRETLPTILFTDTLTLRLGRRVVALRNVGPANTRGDALVWLPAERVAATGDVVVAPVPFAFNAYVGGWVRTLDTLLALRPAVLVPGHGPVMRDDGYVRRVRRMLATVRDSAAAVAARGGTLDDARRAVTLDDDRRAISGGDKWLDFLFRSYFLGPTVARAFQEANAGRA